FSFSYEEADAVYLKAAEIEKLHQFDLNTNKRLEQIRDLFIFGCHTGLRFSDFTAIRPENIITTNNIKILDVITRKTNERVNIPCHPTVLEIFQKYKHNMNMLPRSVSNQKFN